MSQRPTSRVCPLCRTGTTSLHCERDGTGTFQVEAVDVIGASRLNPGDLMGDRYRVIRRVGRGGMGAVYEAEHTGSGQRAAVKVLALELDESGDAEVFFRFFREARITASLKHANTVRLYDFGQDANGALFMAMELLRGPTLQQLITQRVQRGSTLSAAETVAIVAPVLRSLREAHQAGLVHRDLKPDNIILAEQGDDEVTVKVLDFGIARNRDSHITNANYLIGTPAYMSPEQCTGAHLDGRSDLYAIGIVLFCCLTGVTPFRGDAVAQIRGHCDGVPPRVEELCPTPLPPRLIAVIDRALAKWPDERFADAGEMREALEAAVSERVTVSRSWLGSLDSSPRGSSGDVGELGEIENAPTLAAGRRLGEAPHSGEGAETQASMPPPLATPYGWSSAEVRVQSTTRPSVPPKVDSGAQAPAGGPRADEIPTVVDDPAPSTASRRFGRIGLVGLGAAVALGGWGLWPAASPSAAAGSPTLATTAAAPAIAPPSEAEAPPMQPAPSVAAPQPASAPTAVPAAPVAPVPAAPSPVGSAPASQPTQAPEPSPAPAAAEVDKAAAGTAAKPPRGRTAKVPRPKAKPEIEEIQ